MDFFSYYFFRALEITQTINTTIARTIKIPNPIPALNIPPTISQEESEKASTDKIERSCSFLIIKVEKIHATVKINFISRNINQLKKQFYGGAVSCTSS